MALIASLVIVAAGMCLSPGTAVADERTSTARNMPLPKRWHAEYINEPVFDSRLYIVEAGRPKGPPVLLVHGLGQSGYQDWWEVMQALETRYRIVTLDLPGFGRSSTPAGELSPPRYARLLDWLIRRLGLHGVNLVGHSFGAAVALYQAGEYPSGIDNVILIDLAGVLHRVAFVREVAEERMEDYNLPRPLSRYKKRIFDWGGRIAETFMIRSRLDAEQILRRERHWNAILSDQPNINAAVSLLETDYSSVLSNFDRPVTIIWGRNDDVAPIRTGYLLHGILPDSRFHIIDGAGHVPMHTHTREFMKRLQHALQHRPTPRNDTPGETPSRGDLVCSGEPGKTVSGNFDRITIDRCPGMRLVDTRARRITISDSPRIRLRDVEIQSDAAALEIASSDVTATGLRASGNPAIRVADSRLDLAGAILRSPGAALRVVNSSTVIVSVSRVDSGIHKGYLHGALIADDAVLDNASNLLAQ